jgi:hypothetical protein
VACVGISSSGLSPVGVTILGSGLSPIWIAVLGSGDAEVRAWRPCMRRESNCWRLEFQRCAAQHFIKVTRIGTSHCYW